MSGRRAARGHMAPVSEVCALAPLFWAAFRTWRSSLVCLKLAPVLFLGAVLETWRLQLSKNMTARVTMAQGGYDKVTAGEADYRAVLKDEAEAILLEQENRRSEQESTAESLIREYEGRLKDDPENLKLIRSLAELYNRKKEFDKSTGASPSWGRLT